MVKVVQRLLVFACFLLSLSLKAEPEQAPNYKVATEADDVVTRVLFDAVAEHFGVSIQYVNYSSFDAILDSVANGESDFAANITYTSERALKFSYSRPTNIEYTYLYGLNDATLGEASVVGVPKDTIYAELIQQNYPELLQVPYQGHEEAVALLRSGQVDGVVDAINQLKPMLLEGFDAKLLNDQISIKPVSIVSQKGSHLDELSTFANFIHDESVQKHLREQVALYQFELRQTALRESIKRLPIDLEQPLTIKFESIFPYVVYKEDGSIEGMTADVVMKSCKILALNCVVISKPDESWESMYAQFIQGEFDLLAPLTISRERRAFSYFPQPHYQPTSVMVKRLGYKPNVYSHVSQLISERIGVVKDDFFDQMLTQMLPLKELKRFDSQQATLDALLAREIDYIAMDTAMLNHFLRLSELIPIEQDDAIGEFYESELSIGLTTNQRGEILAPYFSRAISMLDLEKIVAQYDLRPDWRTALEYEVRLATQTQAVFVFVLVFAVGVSLYLYRQSNTDNLTGLRNRRSLQLKYRQGVPKDLAVLYLDINHFKQINDTFGHRAGDKVLQLLSLKIHRVWAGRSYRIGGDEFILLGYPTEVQLSRAVEELSSLDVKDEQSDGLNVVTISVGVSAKRERSVSLEQALHLADEDMYSSKQASRNCNEANPCMV
ncbi:MULTISPECIES: GGDEF domain-containing protein [Vibrio]|jgi:diguanylate cyclase (GGDEF)-like protein|uniref:GGDEF domain-containing protein n=1 Tax=Vibrio TaxID=662 RepID=UPI00028EB5A1|nr:MULTISPECIES: GGDEF domain-containing protein [Vibrio]APP03961.1 GGDEF domain-containing protein [Vibrio harveyi]EKM14138.1 diguanylate cyclase domain protein [Vibrio harveyi]EKO3787038.1 GGDEF domain-containing protein [Vibrio harveyi]EKO3812250.1 GGDEF domain-containing protein [Vibrio harveyi]EKO3813986.1 GGDEF domain-containing protein [Vibrio harveyi]